MLGNVPWWTNCGPALEVGTLGKKVVSTVVVEGGTNGCILIGQNTIAGRQIMKEKVDKVSETNTYRTI